MCPGPRALPWCWGRPRCRWPLGWSPRPRVPLAPHGTGPRPGPLGLGLLVSPRPRCAGPSPAAAALASARRSPLRAWGLRSLSPPLRLPPLPAPTPVCPARGLPLRWSAYPLPGRSSTNCRPPSAVPQGPRRILAPASRRPMSRAPRQPLPAGGVPPLRRQSPSTAWGVKRPLWLTPYSGHLLLSRATSTKCPPSTTTPASRESARARPVEGWLAPA